MSQQMGAAPSSVGELAIVIPAYKGHFLRQTLDSIATQTLKRFTVYIGDDASPDDIYGMVKEYERDLEIKYVRFDKNLGGTDLVAQWHRCIAQTHQTWVWLFGDDDMMAPNCVAEFFRCITENGNNVDLLKFAVQEIDATGKVVRPPRPHADHISSEEFVRLRFAGKISSYVPEYIFRREALDKAGGFVSFPLAWCSDDATWGKIALSLGIHSIPSAVVSWRRSGMNITSYRPELAAAKLRAAVQYLDWLHTSPRPLPRQDRYFSTAEFRTDARRWIISHSRYLSTYFLRAGILDAARRLSFLYQGGTLGALWNLLYLDLRLRVRGW